jgi:hypothetical protein
VLNLNFAVTNAHTCVHWKTEKYLLTRHKADYNFCRATMGTRVHVYINVCVCVCVYARKYMLYFVLAEKGEKLVKNGKIQNNIITWGVVLLNEPMSVCNFIPYGAAYYTTFSSIMRALVPFLNSLDRFLNGPRVNNDRKKMFYVSFRYDNEWLGNKNIQHRLIIGITRFVRIVFRFNPTYIFYYSLILYIGLVLMAHQTES